MDEFLTTAEVARWLRVDKATLCRWRGRKVGPRVTWLSPTIPRYARKDVEDWLKEVAA